jgi:hypothetical protein
MLGQESRGLGEAPGLVQIKATPREDADQIDPDPDLVFDDQYAHGQAS